MATLAQRGSGTPATSGTTWTTTTNAVDGAAGTNPATYAVWTSTTSGATAYIEISGYSFASIPADATLNSISVSARHFENNITRIPTVAFQVYDGATTIGASQTCTVATTARNDTATRNPTIAQLKSATFKVRITATRAAVTQSATFNVDYIDVTADYTSPVKQGSATTAHAWVPSATGAKPVVGIRPLESDVLRQTEGAVDRALESAVGGAPPPNEGSATTTWAETPTAAGKRTPRATATTAHAWAPAAAGVKPAVGVKQGSGTTSWAATPAAAGKRTPRATVTTAHAWVPTAAGKKAPRATATTAHAWAPTAAGKRAPKATAAATYVETLGATGKRAPKATAVALHNWTLIAQGARPVVGQKQGSGLVFVAWAPTATGTAPSIVIKQGSAVVAWVEAPTATGKRVPKGFRTTAWSELLTANGKRVVKGTGSTVFVEVATAAGKRKPGATVVVQVVFACQAAGSNGGELVGYYTIAMQWGSEPVVAWQLNGEGASM